MALTTLTIVVGLCALFTSSLAVPASVEPAKNETPKTENDQSMPGDTGPFRPPEVACADPTDCPMSSARPDVVLLKVCEYEIRQFCLKYSNYDVLPCLVDASVDNNKARVMSDGCRKETQVQRWLLSPDFRLGPHRHPACAEDISQHCAPAHGHAQKEPEAGSLQRARQVASCLKKKMALIQLSSDCSAYMMVYMREGTLDYAKDEPFAWECQTEIRRHCPRSLPNNEDESRSGELYECMKLKFLAHFISDMPCRDEMITSLQASRSELRTDPLVYASCYHDLQRHCGTEAPGRGRHMGCILRTLESRVKMELECMHHLRRRMSMWKFGAMISPQSFPEFVVRKSASSYLFAYVNYVVAAGALLLAFVFALAMVAVVNKRRQRRMRKSVAYIRIEQSKGDM